MKARLPLGRLHRVDSILIRPGDRQLNQYFWEMTVSFPRQAREINLGRGLGSSEFSPEDCVH